MHCVDLVEHLRGQLAVAVQEEQVKPRRLAAAIHLVARARVAHRKALQSCFQRSVAALQNRLGQSRNIYTSIRFARQIEVISAELGNLSYQALKAP